MFMHNRKRTHRECEVSKQVAHKSAGEEVNMSVTSRLPNNTRILDTTEPQTTQRHNVIQLSHFHV